jgi:FtsP/CotA-like multicopper oxidase with cupredoxin domain
VYHAHTNAHIEDGLYGAIYIKPNQSQARPFKLISEDPGELERMLEAEKYTQPLILSDWRHLSSSEVWETERRTGIDAFCANAILFNGKGSVTCLSQAFLNQSMTAEQRGALMDKYAMTDMG